MKRLLIKSVLTALLLAVVLCAGFTKTVSAEDDETADTTGTADAVKAVYTAEDLLSIADNPAGSYSLMCDIDMAGVAWPAITFTGTLAGNGHYILNLDTVAVSQETRVTYDGNRKTYDTHFAGLFAILENASVTNVRLAGLDNTQTFDGDCFLGGIAGFASESTISGCEVRGTIRLDVDNGKMFGVGGIIGYGNAAIEDCISDVTLVNIDLDKDHRDEQYLGGICGAGYPDIAGCTITIAGFISDHGYVHSGGMVGMYIIYPKRFDRKGYMKDNNLTGFITFFEDNTNRRAYCTKDYGEVMDWKFTDSGNKYDFKRDERKDYSVNLLPHMCSNPQYEDVVIEASKENPGCTEHTCKTCGYTCRDSYTLPPHNFPDSYESVTEATVDAPGLAEYTCADCGAKIRREIPQLTPTPIPEPSPTETPKPTESVGNTTKDTGSMKSGTSPWVPIGAAVLFITGGLLLAMTIVHKKNRKEKLRKAKRRKR